MWGAPAVATTVAAALNGHSANGAESVREFSANGATTVAESLPPTVPQAVFTALMERHEAATVRLGYLQAQAENVHALAADNRTLEERAAAAEQKAAAEAEARRRVEEEKRRIEEVAEQLRRRVSAAEGALQAERSRGFWALLRGR